MKLISFLIFFLPSLVFAADMSCKDVQMGMPDPSGTVVFSATGLNIEIVSSPKGKYGWVAELTSPQGNATIDDVKIETIKSLDSNLQAMVSLMLPDVDLSAVAEIRLGNIGVDANTMDAGGFMILELLDATGATLGKAATMGWGAGKCGN